jgi:antitoxin component of MazEF toxin-antitoxin module
MKKGLIDPHTRGVWVDTHVERNHWVRKLIKHGGGLCVRIPADLLKELRLEHGAYVMFRREKGVITFSVLPIVKTMEELEEL